MIVIHIVSSTVVLSYSQLHTLIAASYNGHVKQWKWAGQTFYINAWIFYYITRTFDIVNTWSGHLLKEIKMFEQVKQPNIKLWKWIFRILYCWWSMVSASVYPSVLLTQRGQITNKCQSDLFIDTPSSIMIHDARGPVHFVTRCRHGKNQIIYWQPMNWIKNLVFKKWHFRNVNRILQLLLLLKLLSAVSMLPWQPNLDQNTLSQSWPNISSFIQHGIDHCVSDYIL